MLMRILALIALAACGSTTAPPHVLMDFSRPNGLFDAPFPGDDLRTGNTVNVAVIPNPGNAAIVEQVRTLLADADGFAVSGGVFFQISEPLDPGKLPGITASAAADSPTFLTAVDPAAPDYGVRYPLEVSFETDATPYGAPNLLTLLPLQGRPLRAGARYTAIVTTALTTTDSVALGSTDASKFPDSVAAAQALGVSPDQIAGITEFTTGDPTAQLAAVRTAALAAPLPAIAAPFTQTDQFTDFCVYHTTIAMPDYQSGTPPFSSTGGTWQFDATGAPILQRMEPANLTVTIPRTTAPAAGYPLVVFIRTGAGGDRPVVDRGQQAVNGGPAIEPGEGPGRYLARAGFAAIEVDGPLGGLRNTTGGDEDFLTFNIVNLGAMRDNIRESAVELDVIAHVGIALQLDTSDCPGASTAATFDASHVAIMGHSMGSWISPLATAFEPLFRAIVLSGAGGSWIENILYKQKPTAPLEAVTTLLHEFTLLADDPVMTVAQWGLEPADPQVYGPQIVRDPAPGNSARHVLMIQGIVDDYILPRIANSLSLSFGLDLAGPELDTESDPRLAQQLPVGPLLPLAGREMLQLPAAANSGGVTAILTQHLEDGIEDGHEVMFQTDVPKHEYQCFFASWLATGTPSVPTDASRDAPCP